MRSFQNWFIMFALATGLAQQALGSDRASCPVIRPPDPPFMPPAPYSSSAVSHEFLYGGSTLWTVVYPTGTSTVAASCPFFRKGWDWKKGGRPRLTVVARRLDGEGPMVWSGLAGSGFIEGKGLEGMFMVAGIDISSTGCWEIGAQYVDDSGDVQTLAHLSYTVWVEP